MSVNLIIPKFYEPDLGLKETEKAIHRIKDYFQNELASVLNLTRVSAPLFVKAGTGINDDLNGSEQPVSFNIKSLKNTRAEIVQSLAKWKRMTLADYGFSLGTGLYTDMNAIRPDEVLDNIHSLYVDQWDWERVISEDDRNLQFLKSIVEKIYDVLQQTEEYIYSHYSSIVPVLPKTITFFHSEDLEKEYPELTPKEREKIVCEKYGAVFIIGIGGKLKQGEPHDGRAPDYDDWSTSTNNGYSGLNGDIVVHHPVLECPFELSSMGIRVDKKALIRQLEITEQTERKNLIFHKRLLRGELPLSIGGGIGQSRLCMFYLRKAHIGEVQTGIWPDNMIDECRANGITLL